MQKIAAIDIGSYQIKVLFGEKTKEGEFVGHAYSFAYPAFSDLDPLKEKIIYDSFYEKNQHFIIEILKMIKDKYLKNCKNITSFNSKFGKIFVEVIEAESKKKLKLKGDIYSEKLMSEKCYASSKIIGYNKVTKKGEMLIYSYQVDQFRQFQSILDDSEIKIDEIDFDSLSLVNFLENYFTINDNALVIDCSASKTLFIYYSQKRLKYIDVQDFKSDDIFYRMSLRTGEKFHKLKQFLFSDNNPYDKIVELDTQDLLSPYIRRIQAYLRKLNIKQDFKIYLTGGSILIPDFVTQLQSVLEKDVEILYPGRVLPYVTFHQPEQLFANVSGLLMRKL